MTPKIADRAAFPLSVPFEGSVPEWGVTQRQWYKAMAVMGLCANRTEEQLLIPGDKCHQIVADHAGKMADALLAEDAEHEKKKGGVE